MAHRYFVWKNRNPQEWEEITGVAFYALTKSDAAKGRYFAKMAGQDADDDMLIMECTKEVFDKNIKDRNRVDYLDKRDAPYSVESLNTLREKQRDAKSRKTRKHSDRLIDHHADLDLLVNETVCVEKLFRFQKGLNEMDQRIFEHYILNVVMNEKGDITQQKLGKELGISQGRLSQRKKQICELFVKQFDLP